MEEKEKTRHLKIVLPLSIHTNMRRVLYSQGDIQYFFRSTVAALLQGELNKTIGEILDATRERK